MALETGTFISDLNDNNPTSGDPKSQGDDHIRLIKEVLLLTFPLFKGALAIAHDQVASKDYVNNAAFNTVLPGQPGGTISYRLVTKGGMATWQNDSLFANDERLAEVQAAALSIG